MQISSLLLLLALLVVVILFVSRPFGRQHTRSVMPADHEVSSLLAERDRVLDALKELDFDHVMGKVPTKEYPLQRAILLKKGADILRQLDAVTPTSKKDEAVEEHSKTTVPARQTVLSEDDIESLIAARRNSRRERSGGFCPQCGKPVLASDHFCTSCGKTIQ